MENVNVTRSFSCKDEEVPVMCGLVSYNYRRDHLDFEAHSPMYNETFIDGFDRETNEVKELVDPQSETLLRRTITERLHGTINGLLIPVNRLADYVSKSKNELPVTTANFGISLLKSRINAMDIEGVVNALTLVLQNINNHKTILAAKGLSDEMIQALTDAKASIYADKQQQYEITSQRKAMVVANLGKLNALYAKMQDILETGKALYRHTDAAKLKDYTFSELKRSVKIGTATKNETVTSIETK